MSILEYDDEATKQLLAVYITSDIVAQRKEFLRLFGPRPGEKILDVGSGPGFLTTEMAEIVGDDGSVIGIDVSEPLLEIANKNISDKLNISYKLLDAAELPFEDSEFDSVVSTQVLEYIPNVDSVLSETNRVLKAGGRIAILDTDWDSIVWNSSNKQLTNRILKAWEKHAADPFLPRTLASKLKRAGFEVEAQKIIPLYNPNYDPDTYSNRMIDLIVAFVTGKSDITADEAAKWGRELRDFGKSEDYFFSLNRYYFLARKV